MLLTFSTQIFLLLYIQHMYLFLPELFFIVIQVFVSPCIYTFFTSSFTI